MEYDVLHRYLRTRKAATEDFPFGDDVMVFRVGGKMFALLAWKASPLRLTLKCEPTEAEALRETYAAIVPGYHMNKRWWNTITLDGTVPDEDLTAMIDDSYELIRNSLPKAERDALNA